MPIEFFDMFLLLVMNSCVTVTATAIAEFLIKNRLLKRLNDLEANLRTNSIGYKGNNPHKEN